MNNFKQKAFFKFSLIIAFIIGTSNLVFSHGTLGTATSKFLILVETTEDGIKLTSQDGCAWKELTFTLNEDKPQAVDQMGMAPINQDKATKDTRLANFLFIIKKTKNGISLDGKDGTAWTNLSFSFNKGKCYQYIDFNGMASKKD